MVWCFFPVLQVSANIVADLESYDRDVRGILTKYCVDCHGPDKQKGDVRLDAIDPDVVKGRTLINGKTFEKYSTTGKCHLRKNRNLRMPNVIC